MRWRRFSVRERTIYFTVTGVMAALILTAGQLILPSLQAASASTKQTNPAYECTSQHCYDVARAQNTYDGIEGEWNDAQMVMTSTEVNDGSHTSNEIWLINTATTPYIEWVETGISRGCSQDIAPSTTITCNAQGYSRVYQQFWATGTHNGAFFFHHISTISGDGNYNTYEILNPSNCANDTYDVYVDGPDTTYSNHSTDQIACTGNQLQAGMELFSYPDGINSNEWSGNFYNTIDVYTASQGYWRSAILDSTVKHTNCDWADNCVMDNCANYVDGICLHSSRVSDSEWEDNKPS